jgi:alpha-amylase/alpha-mannosidase (GH57 family)
MAPSILGDSRKTIPKQTRFLCVHAHFYQPPRESPWLEEIELQDSAYPYHDWNERITAECYATNLKARILDNNDRIVRIVNNYAHISFNFGPTLLSWAQVHAVEVYNGVLEADRQSLKRFSGHGSAIAQAYSHMIMPLSDRRDKETQIKWGIADFEARFKRKPEGMWLPETAVDTESLELMAENGLTFTVLAPRQARAIRKIGDQEWTEVPGSSVDPSRAYRCPLPSGRNINLFFYDGPVSQAVAFEKLLDNGEKFVSRLVGAFSDSRTWPQLMHIATDGETYGHHHRFGEMALAYALDHVESKGLARITNYGEFLELCPPEYEAQIIDNTSWSCIHGIERWRSNCGCNSGRVGFSQHWRAPLRVALDWLRDKVRSIFEEAGVPLLKDIWKARDAYIAIVLDRSPEARHAFGAKYFRGQLTETEQVIVWKLLEIQRQAMLMYTSCGWFFDELSGIETVQVIQYAGRVVQLAEQIQPEPLEKAFLDRLALAKSNVPEQVDGANIYRRYVSPAVVDLSKVAAHYAISSLFVPYSPQANIFFYTVQRLDFHMRTAGKLRMALGKALFTSRVTQGSATLTFWAIHFGDHNIVAGVRGFVSDSSYDSLAGDILDSFSRIEIPEVVRLLDREFGKGIYSLKSLFRDEQRRILQLILSSSLAEAEVAYLHLYENHAALMRFMSAEGSPIPGELRTTIEFALNTLLRRACEAEELDGPRIRELLSDAHMYHVHLDQTTIEFALRNSLERLSAKLSADPGSIVMLERLEQALQLAQRMPFPVNLRAVQNRAYDIYTRLYPRYARKAARGDAHTRAWLGKFREVAQALSILVS